jgi:hypothetical protein
MTGVRTMKYGGFPEGYTCEAVVTMCQVGVNGWHIHSRYLTACGSIDCAGKCGTVATLEDATDLFESACQLAASWASQH